MSEIYETFIPIVRSRVPPKPIMITAMIDIAAEKVGTWVESLKPDFTEMDSIQMMQFKLIKKGVEIKYQIIRNKRKEEFRWNKA